MSSTEKITGMIAIKMTNKEFISEFSPSFNTIANLPTTPKSGKLKYAIKRSIGSVQKAGESFTKKMREFCETHAALTDEGNPKTENDQYVWKDSDARKLAEKEVEKLNNVEIILQVYPVHLSTITDCLSATRVISMSLEINLREFIVENADMNRQIEEDEKNEKKSK